MFTSYQLPLLLGEPGPPRLHRQLLAGGAWLDRGHLLGASPYSRGTVDPTPPPTLYAQLLDGVGWRHERRIMYQREVDVPRLVARLPADGPVPPAVQALRRWLEAHYQRALPSVSANWYRNGQDSVAWHRDRLATDAADSLVALLTLGAERPFLVRPRGGGDVLRLFPGPGEVLVMGGRFQQAYEHAVPKVPASLGRISVQFREFDDPG